jgi:type I restriction enzyme R subunit
LIRREVGKRRHDHLHRIRRRRRRTRLGLEALGYSILHGPDIAAGEPGAERSDANYRGALLERRLRETLVRLNHDLPPEALEDPYRKLTGVDAPSLVERNRAVRRMLVDGVTVEYRRKDGSIAGASPGHRLRRAREQ